MPRAFESCSWLKLSATRASRIRTPTYSSIFDLDFAFMAALGVPHFKQKPCDIAHRPNLVGSLSSGNSRVFPDAFVGCGK
jgi:hypothetical protein